MLLFLQNIVCFNQINLNVFLFVSNRLIKYCMEHQKTDVLVTGITQSENPFKENKACTLLQRLQQTTIQKKMLFYWPFVSSSIFRLPTNTRVVNFAEQTKQKLAACYPSFRLLMMCVRVRVSCKQLDSFSQRHLLAIFSFSFRSSIVRQRTKKKKKKFNFGIAGILSRNLISQKTNYHNYYLKYFNTFDIVLCVGPHYLDAAKASSRQKQTAGNKFNEK